MSPSGIQTPMRAPVVTSRTTCTSTWFCHQVPAEGVHRRCEEVMREVCTNFEAESKQFNGEQDHVQLLVHDPPKAQLSKLVNSLEGGLIPTPAPGVRQPRPQVSVGRALLVRLLLRRLMRRSTTDRRTPVRRQPAAPHELRQTAQSHAHTRVRAVLRWPSPLP
jgi:putative transposase